MIYASAANTPARLGIGSTDQILKVSGGVPVWATPASASPASATATVSSEQSTTSTSFTDLATAGPAVTLTTGTKALVIVSARIRLQGGYGDNAYMGYAVSGASTVAAAQATSLSNSIDNSSYYSKVRASAATITTLTAGSNTFTAKYSTDGNTGYYTDRQIIVIDLGS